MSKFNLLNNSNDEESAELQQFYKRLKANPPPDPTKRYLAALASYDYIVDELLECGLCHMLIGSTDAAKTRFLLTHIIQPIVENKNVLGHKTKPANIIYLTCDRPSKSTLQTWKKMGQIDWVLKNKLRIYSNADMRMEFGRDLRTMDILELPHLFPHATMFVIEALQGLVHDVKDYDEGIQFWGGIQLLLDNGLTILGTGHIPKSTANIKVQQLSNRNLMMGSVSNAGCVHTIMYLYNIKPNDPGWHERELKIHYKDRALRHLKYEFDTQGVLQYKEEIFTSEEKEESTEVNLSKEEMLDKFVTENYNPGATLLTSTLVELGSMLRPKISDATVERWIKKRVEDGVLFRVARGEFRFNGFPSGKKQ